MKTKRNLSGIYFRFKNPETGVFENRCFEDMTVEEQRRHLKDRSVEWLTEMVILLSDTINRIGDQFDIVSE